MLYFHSKHTRNRVTVCGDFCEDGLCLTAARCSDKDNFCRKEGRIRAEGRFNKKRTCITVPVEEANLKTFVDLASKFADFVSVNIKFKDLLKQGVKPF